MDISYLLLLQQFRALTADIFTSLFLLITAFGEDLILFTAAAGIYWCLDKRAGIYLFFNFHLGNLFNNFLKVTACVYRPWIRDQRVMPVEAAKPGAGGYSFPSGHTAKAVSIWGGLGRLTFRSSRALALFMGSLAILVGFSRNYLGVHTPQDVLVSLILGCFFIWASDRLLLHVDRRPSHDKYLLCAGFLLSAALILYALYKPYPEDYVNGTLLVNPASMVNGCFKGCGGIMGFLAGWFWERRKIHFDEKQGPWEEKVLRFLLGGALLAIVIKVLPTVFVLALGGKAGAFANGFFAPLFITALYPLLVQKLSQNSDKGRRT